MKLRENSFQVLLPLCHAGPDRIPDIMDQIMVASGDLIASYDSGDMVRQARILAQATAELIQAIKGEAESQSDSDLQVQYYAVKCVELLYSLLVLLKYCTVLINVVNVVQFDLFSLLKLFP